MDNDLNYGSRERLIDSLEQKLHTRLNVSINESNIKDKPKISYYTGTLDYVSKFTFGLKVQIGKGENVSSIVKAFKLNDVLIEKVVISEPEDEAQ